MDRSLSQDLPAIRQTIFKVDVTRRYQFDVNQNITIYKLKKMLHAASNLEKVRLKLFYDGEEYTNYDLSTLDSLFPNRQTVEFDLKLSYDNIEDFDPLFKKVNFDQSHCPHHPGKYPYFYCYDCKKSLCSQCRESGHIHHSIREKFDYLQSSRKIIEEIFKDLNLNLDFTNPKTIEEVKNKFRANFDYLAKMLKDIEASLEGLIDDFFLREKEAIGKHKMNAEELKKKSIEGLNKLKSEKRIEDIMLSEKIFLIFDTHIKAIEFEKRKFLDDVRKHQQYVGQLELISKEGEKTYNEIYTFLLQYLRKDIFSTIMRELSKFSVKPLDTQSIIDRINDDVKQITEFQERTIPSRRGSYYKSQPRETTRKEGVISIDHEYPVHQIIFDNTQKTIVSHSIVPEDDFIDPNDVIICQVVEGTSEVMIFSKLTNSIRRKTINPPLYSKLVFNYNSAWFNYNNKMYVSGGIESNGEQSNLFLEYNPIDNVCKVLTNLPEARSHHSMFIENNNIFIIGGTSKNCYKYSLREYSFENIGWLNNLRYNPVLYKKGNAIYAFFGTNSAGHYFSNAEVKQERSLRKWDILELKGERNVKIIQCGIIQSDSNKILFIGGLNEDGTVLSSIMAFDLERNTLTMTDMVLKEGAYFQQSLLTLFGDSSYGNFSLEPNNPIFMIRFG